MSDTDKSGTRRFTISLELSAHEELGELAASHGTPLSLQYVVRYAHLRFLYGNKDQQLKLDIE